MARENVGLLLNEVGALVMKDTEKVAVIECLLCFSLCTAKGWSSRNPRPWKQERKSIERKTCRWLRMIRLESTSGKPEHPQIHGHKSMGSAWGDSLRETGRGY